ncbi:hypothetical protein BJ875DRAFT_469809 [Amylocarpus encephaloides]|uniref:Uncharacterized protein n=1 Tax=Amylocarpus encephaloides TaxID=45428 RepID=A0A9P7YCR9_9HELO|nr:hypothetical protein BJ875DRAFT_469809 [Amylocarpus encephaloides]
MASSFASIDSCFPDVVSPHSDGFIICFDLLLFPKRGFSSLGWIHLLLRSTPVFQTWFLLTRMASSFASICSCFPNVVSLTRLASSCASIGSCFPNVVSLTRLASSCASIGSCFPNVVSLTRLASSFASIGSCFPTVVSPHSLSFTSCLNFPSSTAQLLYLDRAQWSSHLAVSEPQCQHQMGEHHGGRGSKSSLISLLGNIGRLSSTFGITSLRAD